VPKLKTHSGSKDRIKVTKSGRLLHRRAARNHFLQKKTASSKRKLFRQTELKGKSKKNIKRKLGI
jgi:large subunit ribosomal protein L35